MATQLLLACVSAEKVLSLLKERNRILKIADTHGWDTVSQYISNPLAPDEQDDKKLRRAIKMASQAREKSKADKEAKARHLARARAFTKESALSPSRLGPIPSSNQRYVVPPTDKKLSSLHCYRCGKIGRVIRDCVTNIGFANNSSQK